MTRLLSVLIIASLAPALPSAPRADGQAALTPFSAFLLDEARELALARSAAPPDVTGNAGIHLLSADGGYHRVAPSKNGWECLVQRSFTTPATATPEFLDPRIIAPICFNAEAAATLMQRDLMIAPLVKRGLSLEAVRQAERRAYDDGTLRYPTKPAIAYMFSAGQWLGQNIGAWHPHVMIWAPGLTAGDLAPSDVGSFGVHSGWPVGDFRYGPKQPLIVIPTATFIRVEDGGMK